MPPVTYTALDKARVFKSLIEHLGDVDDVVEETGIPERTVRRWRYQFQPTTSAIIMPNELDANRKRRRDFYAKAANELVQLVEITIERMKSNPETIADLSIHLARLLDRCAKAEELAAENDFNIVILWENRDGMIQDTFYPLDELPFENLDEYQF